MPRFRFFDTPLQALVRELPLRALLPLGLAVFALFSILGPVTDLLDGARKPPLSAVRNGVLSGLFALGYGYGAMRRSWPVLRLTGATQFAWIVGNLLIAAEPPSAAPVDVAARLKIDGLWVLASMVTSYTCFLWFIKGTATRYLRVRAEIELAHQIHQVLVPPIAETHGEFEFAGLSIASGEVGGDLVDVLTLASNPALPPPDGREPGWFGYVADVSGHGVSSGVVMGMFKSALRMRLLHPGPLSALLGDLNAVLLPLTSSSMFVTVACVRGGTGGTLEYSVAGHLPILRVRAGTTDPRAVEELTTPQIPIGMFEDYRFTSATLECGRGDVLALITDGLTEVFDAKDEQFGMDAVKAILGRLAGRPLAEISQAIVGAARAHGTQIDDQTLLLIRRR
jgi:serine phosphatase RsbU (regulator of sigma subunit)